MERIENEPINTDPADIVPFGFLPQTVNQYVSDDSNISMKLTSCHLHRERWKGRDSC